MSAAHNPIQTRRTLRATHYMLHSRHAACAIRCMRCHAPTAPQYWRCDWRGGVGAFSSSLVSPSSKGPPPSGAAPRIAESAARRAAAARGETGDSAPGASPGDFPPLQPRRGERICRGVVDRSAEAGCVQCWRRRVLPMGRRAARARHARRQITASVDAPCIRHLQRPALLIRTHHGRHGGRLKRPRSSRRVLPVAPQGDSSGPC